MKGTEKIIAHIEAEAKAEAQTVLAKAAEEVQQIRASYFKTALTEHKRLIDEGKAECEDLVARQKRMAEMEARKSVLALKQEMVAAVFEEARRELADLPGEEYVAFLAKMASEAASSGTEELLLNERDKAGCGKAVCKAANALLTAKGMHGGLTLSEDTADIAGGLILRQGGIEVNCAVDTLIEQQRGSLSAQVAAELFE